MFPKGSLKSFLRILKTCRNTLESLRASFHLTVYSGASLAEATLLGLPSLEQTVVNVPDELLQLRVRRVHYLRAGFTQDPCAGPLLRGQSHYQQDHRGHTEHRGHRERDPFPQRRHLRSPWCPEDGNTTPGSDREAKAAISMSLFCRSK